jgi:integrase
MYIPEAKFYLKSLNVDEPTLISLQIKFNGHRVFMSTGEKVHPKKWDFNTQRGVGKENGDLNFWLNKIATEVSTLFRNYNIDGVSPDAALVQRQLKEKLDNTPAPVKQAEVKMTFVKFIEQYIEQSKSVKKHETIKAYRTTLNHLLNYSKTYRKPIDFENIHLDFYYDFTDYIAKDLGNSKNTVAKQVKTIKTFMNEATDRGLNTNLAFKSRSFKKVTEVVDKIYLTKEEIEKIYKLDLSKTKTKEIVRDLFVVSCYTGLRFSDFTNIKKEDIRDEKIFMKTNKTDQYVVIPIASIVKEILKKYNHNLPAEISNQKMNEYLKEIGEMAEINDPIVITKTKSGKRIQATFKKHQLISAHCGRRSFATNAYKDKVPAISIMKITGHTSEKAFLGYIRISQEENAELMKGHRFFN